MREGENLRKFPLGKIIAPFAKTGKAEEGNIG